MALLEFEIPARQISGRYRAYEADLPRLEPATAPRTGVLLIITALLSGVHAPGDGKQRFRLRQAY